MRVPTVCILAVVSIGATAGAAGAESDTYLYHPELTLALGRGFAPSILREPMAPCISFEAQRLDPGPPSTTFSYVYVTSEDELYKAMGYELRAEASYIGTKGSAGVKASTVTTFNSRMLNVIVRAHTDFGRWGLKAGAALTNEALALRDDPAGFASVCGTRYVAIERRGASVSVLLTIALQSDSRKSTVERSLNISGGSGAFSGSAKASFNSELRSASKQGRLSIQISSTGGAGLGSLGSVVKTAAATESGLDAVRDGLADFLSAFTVDNAAAVEYVTASMKHFGWQEEQYIGPSLDYQLLSALADEYDRIDTNLGLIKALKDTANPLRKALTSTTLQNMNDSEENLLRWRDTIRSAHSMCKESADRWCTQFFENGDPNKLMRSPNLPLPDGFFEPPYLRFVSMSVFGAQRPADQTLSDDAIRVILDAPTNLRKSVRQRSDPYLGPFASMIEIQAPYPIATNRIVFVNESTGEDVPVFIEALVPERGVGEVYGLTYYWTSFDATPAYNLEAQLMDWAKQFHGTQKGSFVSVLKDAAGREWRLAFLDAEWRANGTALQYFNSEIVQ